MEDAESFWAQVDRSGGPEADWSWTGAVNTRTGYGYLTFRLRQRSAHVVAYDLSHGPAPEGMLVMHLCGNPLCCNPSHLSLGTRAEVMARRSRLRRLRRPDENEENG